MSFMEVPINMATCLIGGIALGVAVDDTIFFLTRFRMIKAEGNSYRESIRKSILTVGNSMVATSCILVFGFITMITSSFLPSAQFGFFVSVTLLSAVVFDLLFVPSVLHLFAPEVSE